MITDGVPSFKYQTAQAIHKLRDMARLSIVQIKEFPSAENQALLKEWVSQPWEINYMHVPGKKALEGGLDVQVSSLVQTVCPRVISPSLTEERDMERGFSLMKEGGLCGKPSAFAIRSSPEECLAFAKAGLTPGYEFKECRLDDPNRDVPLMWGDRRPRDECASACAKQGTKYYAVQYGGQCACGGDEAGHAGFDYPIRPDGECNNPNLGHYAQTTPMMGNGWRNAIYTLKEGEVKEWFNFAWGMSAVNEGQCLVYTAPCEGGLESELWTSNSSFNVYQIQEPMMA
jgi:hypothetical protein